MIRRVVARLIVGPLAGLVSVSCSSAVTGRPHAGGTRYPSVAFVVACSRSHELPDDPIVHPGKPGASHVHSFFGNVSTSAKSTYRSMQGARTTCRDSADTGAYWAPSPSADAMRAYYDRGSIEAAAIVPPAADLKLIAGDPKAVNPVGVDVVAFRCGVIADGPDRGEWEATPPSTCSGPGTPIVRYTFAQTGNIPRLRLLMAWVGPAPMGVAPHADFWNTWNERRLAELTAICIRGERTTNLAIKQCGLPGAS
jgi:Domain of unknown function (DUF1996)